MSPGIARRAYGGFQHAFDAFDQPGPGFGASPFSPGSVTTSAGLLKAITAIASARQGRANYEQARKDREAGLYRAALQTRLLEKQLAEPSKFDQMTAAERALAASRTDDPSVLISPDYAKELGVEPNAAGGVPSSLYRTAHDRAMLHKPTGSGSETSLARLALAGAASERAARASTVRDAMAKLEVLDTDAEQVGDIYENRADRGFDALFSRAKAGDERAASELGIRGQNWRGMHDPFFNDAAAVASARMAYKARVRARGKRDRIREQAAIRAQINRAILGDGAGGEAVDPYLEFENAVGAGPGN